MQTNILTVILIISVVVSHVSVEFKKENDLKNVEERKPLDMQLTFSHI